MLARRAPTAGVARPGRQFLPEQPAIGWRHAPRACKQRSSTVRVVAAKMYVPGDSLNGLSPERRAALHLKQMFTYLAARWVQHANIERTAPMLWPRGH